MTTTPALTASNVKPLTPEQVGSIQQILFENKSVKWGQIRWVAKPKNMVLQQECWTTDPTETTWVDVPILKS